MNSMEEEAEMSMQNALNRLNAQRMNLGCAHYKRRCRIRGPCCNKGYNCPHCHNEAMSHSSDPNKCPELHAWQIERVICSLCWTDQSVKQVCENCGVNMGQYYCPRCKIFEDDASKEVFHCDDCGICRVGVRDNFFHCNKCGACYSVNMQTGHNCVEDALRHDCPVCREYLFDSRRKIKVLQCGHTIHRECLEEMKGFDQNFCPECLNSTDSMPSIGEWDAAEA